MEHEHVILFSKVGRYNQNPVLSSFMTDHRVLNKSNTAGATCGTGTAYLSFLLDFSEVRVAQSLVVLFFRQLCYLPIFDLRLLIAPLKSSYIRFVPHKSLCRHERGGRGINSIIL